MTKPAYLVLENGMVFAGEAMGAEGEAIGEVVFTTAMTGYLETLTDPGNYGQIVVHSFPLIGNYGIIPSDFESETAKLNGYIVSQWCSVPSNFRQEGTLDTFLKSRGIVGLCGVDTRALIGVIRKNGTMNGKIVTDISDIPAAAQNAKSFRITGAVGSVPSAETRIYTPEQTVHNVALWDFGVKQGVIRELMSRGCKVTVLPATATADDILALNPDGLVLSGGPGDPAENTGIISELTRLLGKSPIFGVCLGHLLLALAHGAASEKLRHGHRGSYSVKDLNTGRNWITSQNHGYSIVNESVGKGARVSFTNANDGTCEGIDYYDFPAFSVQFRPEACAGPLDTNFLFDRFVDMMGNHKAMPNPSRPGSKANG